MTRPTASLKQFSLWLLAFFLAVFGAQCWLVWLYGSPLPFWDQWDEALTLFKPWLDGHLTWADVAAPASDHRIILTHWLDLGLICLNGRWDPLLQMAVNALIHAVSASGLAFCLWHFGGRGNPALVCGVLLPFFTLPFAGENAVWGMNSLWYLINLFAVATIIGMGFFRVGTWPWWLGLAAAVLGLLSMALGPVAPMAVGGLTLLRALKHRRLEKEHGLSLGACLLLVGLGAAFMVRAEGYRPLQAHSFFEFADALVRHLDWPFYQFRGMACVVALPVVLLLVYYLRPNFQATRAAELLLTLALWSLLASAMLAFGRAHYGEGIPASRYTEVFALLLITSIFATMLLLDQWAAGRAWKWAGRLPALVYAAVVFWGLCQMSDLVVSNLLLPTRMINLVAEERIAAFNASGKDSDLLQPPTIRPKPETVLLVLRDPKLQSILPVACLPDASRPEPGWLTAAARWVLRQGSAILILGLALIAGLGVAGLARGTMDLSVRKPEGMLALLAGLAAVGLVWFHQPVQRQSVDYNLQRQLASYFTAEGNPGRAAIHAHLADELKGLR